MWTNNSYLLVSELKVQIFQAHTNELTLCTIILTSSLSETWSSSTLLTKWRPEGSSEIATKKIAAKNCFWRVWQVEQQQKKHHTWTHQNSNKLSNSFWVLQVLILQVITDRLTFKHQEELFSCLHILKMKALKYRSF